jgi:hypothetical protein
VYVTELSFLCITNIVHADSDPEAGLLRLGYVSSGITFMP